MGSAARSWESQQLPSWSHACTPPFATGMHACMYGRLAVQKIGWVFSEQPTLRNGKLNRQLHCTCGKAFPAKGLQRGMLVAGAWPALHVHWQVHPRCCGTATTPRHVATSAPTRTCKCFPAASANAQSYSEWQPAAKLPRLASATKGRTMPLAVASITQSYTNRGRCSTKSSSLISGSMHKCRRDSLMACTAAWRAQRPGKHNPARKRASAATSSST